MVTAGIGSDVWKYRAECTAKRFRELNPWCNVRVIDRKPAFAPNVPSPSWLKLWAWEVAPPWTELLIWLDADIVPVRPFDESLPSGDFVGVKDVDQSANLQTSRINGWNAGYPYINMGFWVAKRETRPAFEIAKQLMLRGASKWCSLFWEQGWLNFALQIARVSIKTAPREYNWMPGFGHYRPNVVQVHDAGGDHHRLADAWRFAEQMRDTPKPRRQMPAFARPLQLPSSMRVRVYEGHGTTVKQQPKPAAER
jgi:hypothetical protein